MEHWSDSLHDDVGKATFRWPKWVRYNGKD